MKEKKDYINFLIEEPAQFGHLVGFTKLTELHNKWIRKMILSKEDFTLQAHRESYKTTCVSIALALLTFLKPKEKRLFIRKTDTNTKEIIFQVKKILKSEYMQYFSKKIYGVNLLLTKDSQNEINTNLAVDVRGTSQLIGLGIGSSITGKHFEDIFTDDIINIDDRISKAERDRTKLMYQELQNIKSRGGRIINTGTPWHPDDCFILMPKPEVYDCYSTGLMTKEIIQQKKDNMTTSLFAANYELKHIASEDIIFNTPNVGADISNVEQGIAHIDAAYGGEDYTAFTICKKKDGIYYVFGKLKQTHVDNCLEEMLKYYVQLNCGKLYTETNGDKGYLAKEIKKRNIRVYPYHEDMNKFLKITSYLKFEWKNVVFVAGTDKEYIDMICNYHENVEHDDAPDSLASLIRVLWGKKEEGKYISPFF